MIYRHLLRLTIGLLLGGLVAWQCGKGAGTGDTTAQVIKIVATGNVKGEIEPCG